ncbi:class I SAM-dependent methyltransferase [Sporosarcina highlanderae]|uniref:Class I SAM-dependent methyltransferase n=1 Tax=Sporosarcina highlanderae TaxID=3035916 RepID=A0ABT8JM86_9BACL|nr:class I SAM-dependent methyltransferase [Sporosarcina highlanderae]MDN4606180.1 class I SAM-dependent methyltransferase [Sporosarcina highlanderae]
MYTIEKQLLRLNETYPFPRSLIEQMHPEISAVPRSYGGVDLSKTQIETAKELLKDCKAPVHLFESPMEENPGLPFTYFDIVYSIYALGWTSDLRQTLTNVHDYLKPGGIFVFSWEHPLHSRASWAGEELHFNKSYHEEGTYDHEAWHAPAIMQQYRVSTYINTLIECGFEIEKVIEDVSLTEEDRERHVNRWYSFEKAKMMPTTLIIKCVKKG